MTERPQGGGVGGKQGCKLFVLREAPKTPSGISPFKSNCVSILLMS